MPLRRLLRLIAALLFAGCGEVNVERPRAASAAAFVDSIGVNVHMSFSDTPYVDVDRVRRRLRELGIRHVRDGIVLGRPDQYAALRALGEDGVRAQFILGDPAGRFGTGTLAQQLATLDRELLGVAAAVEGPNEYDVAGDPAWAERLRAYQSRLRRAVERDPRLARLSVVGPSLVLPDSRRKLGDLAGELDFGNVHPYPAAQPPERNLSGEIRLASLISGERPVVATETGYHDALAAQEGQPPVSERAAAVYLPRLFLHYFRSGIRRTYAYELVDERPDPERRDLEASFGLLRQDFAPKPSFIALRNLIAAVAPTGAAEGTPPPYRLTGETGGVQRLLLDRGGGRFALVLWREARVWDAERRADLDVGGRRVTLELPEAVKAAEVVRPLRSARPAQRVRVSRALRLTVPGDPLVVALTT